MTDLTASLLDPALLDDVADRWLDAWNRLDGEALATLCTDDIEFFDPAIGTVHGRRAVADWVRTCARAFPTATSKSWSPRTYRATGRRHCRRGGWWVQTPVRSVSCLRRGRAAKRRWCSCSDSPLAFAANSEALAGGSRHVSAVAKLRGERNQVGSADGKVIALGHPSSARGRRRVIHSLKEQRYA